jgi:hypothetical protein
MLYGSDTISSANVKVCFKLYGVNNKNEKGIDDEAKGLFIKGHWENSSNPSGRSNEKDLYMKR